MATKKTSGKQLADMMYGGDQMRATPQSRITGPIANAVRKAQQFAGQYELDPRIPLLGGTGVDELLSLPDAASLLEDLSYNGMGALVRGGNAATGGLGTFRPDPRIMSVADVAGTATGVGQLGSMAAKAAPRAIKAGARNLAAPRTLNPQAGVVKMKGGNWLGGSVEGALKGLKRDAAPQNLADELGIGDDNAKTIALNNWVDRNLTNYVKKEMATLEDPVRRLAEQGISHLPQDEVEIANRLIPERLAVDRMMQGFPPEGMGQSAAAKNWEELSDSSLNVASAGMHTRPLTDTEIRQGFKSTVDDNPWLNKLDPATPVFYPEGDMNVGLGFDHIMDVLREDLASGRIRPEQLNKVSMEQAVRRTYEFDQEMAKKMREAAIKQTEGFPVTKEYPEGYKWIELTAPKNAKPIDDGFGNMSSPGYEELEKALKYEGDTMGHCVGGYCDDVYEGHSRIYSLRDAKGEPHVTVEVQPNQYAPRWDSVKQYMDQAREQVMKDRAAKGMPLTDQYENEIDRLVEATAVKMAQKEAPPEIVQIKGKQNRAPNPEYLPFVQDFVRSGEWSDVGDLRNTGLIDMKKSGIPWPENTTPGAIDQLVGGMEYGTAAPKYKGASELTDELVKKSGKRYVTQQEFDDLLLQELRPPAPEGMKRGGGVHFSDNPDVMQLELAGGGGVKALLKAAKEAVKPPIKASEALGSIEGRPLVITQADRTKVGGGFLGGPGFSGLQLEDPAYRAAEAAWAVKNPGTAKMILGGRGESKDAVYAAMLGTPTQHQSNQMVFDKLLGDFKRAAKKGELEPELRDRINLRLANSVDKDGNNIFPPDVDILDKNFKDLASTFDRRSVTANLIGGMGVGGKKGQIIDYDKIIRNTTDPVLIDAPTGALGNRLFTLNGGIIDRPDLHPAFPTIMQGEDLGVSFDPVARNLIMRDFTEKTMREKGRAPGIFDYTRGYPPSQLITEDILTDLQKMGKKAGGAVKVEQQVQGSAPTKKKSEHHVQNPVHFTESPDVMRLALTKRN